MVVAAAEVGVVAAGVHVLNMLEEVAEDTVEIELVSVGGSLVGAGGNLGVVDAEPAVAGGRTAAGGRTVLGAGEQCHLKNLEQMQHNP